MQLLDVRLDRRPTLLDYLAGGGTIKLLAALDFSRSNPPDAGPGSMHHADPDHPSACEQVVAAFASSLQVRHRHTCTLNMQRPWSGPRADPAPRGCWGK